jgi:enamine deaminase RidA (YjgF/YER057c/UK114 family)
VEVSALPKGAKIEIEVIACAHNGVTASDISG